MLFNRGRFYTFAQKKCTCTQLGEELLDAKYCMPWHDNFSAFDQKRILMFWKLSGGDYFLYLYVL